jgi:site-specific recombinase XerD
MTLTHEQTVTKFVDHLTSLQRSPSTIIAYKKDIEQLFEHYTGKKLSIVEYNAKDIEQYIVSLIEEGKFTLKTVSRKINSYKTLFKYLHKERVMELDIASSISHPTFKAKDPRILSSMEYKALRDTARKNVRLYAMVELLLQTGMRIGELSRLKISDVDLKITPASIFVTEYASNDSRTVTLNESGTEAIKKYIEKRPTPKNDEGYLFTTKSGKQVLVRNVRTMINNAFKKSDIKNATVNDIRNTFIVFQLEHGMPLEKVASMVGHKRITSTEKYLKLVEEKKGDKVSKVIPL